MGPSSASWQRNTFRIQDRTNIYFFDEGWPGVEVPEFLRPEDIIPSGSSTLDPSNYERVRSELRLSNEEMNDAIYACNQEVLEKLGTRDIPFNKPVNRVSERGGIPEQYNSRIQQWQQFGDQIYKPSLVQRARVVLGIH